MAHLVMMGRIAPRNRQAHDRGSWIAATLDFVPPPLTQPVPRYLLIAEGLLPRDPVSPYAASGDGAEAA